MTNYWLGISEIYIDNVYKVHDNIIFVIYLY